MTKKLSAQLIQPWWIIIILISFFLKTLFLYVYACTNMYECSWGCTQTRFLGLVSCSLWVQGTSLVSTERASALKWYGLSSTPKLISWFTWLSSMKSHRRQENVGQKQFSNVSGSLAARPWKCHIASLWPHFSSIKLGFPFKPRWHLKRVKWDHVWKDWAKGSAYCNSE